MKPSNAQLALNMQSLFGYVKPGDASLSANDFLVAMRDRLLTATTISTVVSAKPASSAVDAADEDFDDDGFDDDDSSEGEFMPSGRQRKRNPLMKKSVLLNDRTFDDNDPQSSGGGQRDDYRTLLRPRLEQLDSRLHLSQACEKVGARGIVATTRSTIHV